MEDKTLTCEECGKPFEFTAGEQQLYQGQGIEEPRICKDCRRSHYDESSEALHEGEGGAVGGLINT
ncbi:MAG TPA: zinc-ribbon domain containing protein [Blastocatellia bacterium]|nr:zinc-ribbon domain containing protein [Blastocatellia bacterium]